MKFHQNPSSDSRVVLCGRIYGHHEANSHFSQFCECALNGRCLILVAKFNATIFIYSEFDHFLSFLVEAETQRFSTHFPVGQFTSTFTII
jgi:hypothetical protein